MQSLYIHNAMNSPIWGTENISNIPLVIPENVLNWRIKLRPNSFATIYLKYSNSTAAHRLYKSNNILVIGPKLGENIHRDE